ncbi:unnamed protein product, partial [Scytosiphon promiscuus]
GGGGGDVPQQANSCVVCEARSLSTGYYYAQQRGGTAVAAATGGSQGVLEDEERAAAAAQEQRQAATAAEMDRDRAQRTKVASCLAALQSSRAELESFSEELEQAHMQALAEAFAARYKSSIGPASPAGGGEACACSPPPQSQGGDEDPSSRLRAETAALAELAAAPFMDNELFVLIRALEQQLLNERRRERRRGNAAGAAGETGEAAADGEGSGGATDAGGGEKDWAVGAAASAELDGGHTICGKPGACLDSLLTSRALRVLAEESAEKGLDEKAAAYFEQAKSLVEDVVEEEEGRLPRPSRYLAELRAGVARCQMRQGDLESASAEAGRALEEHPACGEAFLVRGQCRQKAGNDNKGALSDLVNAFVLRGSALNPGGDAG